MSDRSAQTGAAIYTPFTLWGYDFVVLTVSNRIAWKCPTPLILDFYNTHVSANHLDVGVGTGYFLDRCRFPAPNPRITLFDLNPHSLAATSRRLQRYQPITRLGNVLEPAQFDGKFDSIGLSYLLHCLPGTLHSKQVVFDNLKAWLNPGGMIFGATLLGQGVPANVLAQRMMRFYNSKGVFSNAQDNLSDLEGGLKANFRDCETKVVGCVAFFAGRV